MLDVEELQTSIANLTAENEKLKADCSTLQQNNMQITAK